MLTPSETVGLKLRKKTDGIAEGIFKINFEKEFLKLFLKKKNQLTTKKAAK